MVGKGWVLSGAWAGHPPDGSKAGARWPECPPHSALLTAPSCLRCQALVQAAARPGAEGSKSFGAWGDKAVAIYSQFCKPEDKSRRQVFAQVLVHMETRLCLVSEDWLPSPSPALGPLDWVISADWGLKKPLSHLSSGEGLGPHQRGQLCRQVTAQLSGHVSSAPENHKAGCNPPGPDAPCVPCPPLH